QALDAKTRGFRFAEIALTLRGEGDLFGTKQSGLPEFRFATLPEDSELLELARRESIELLRQDPHLADPEHAVLREALEMRFGVLETDRIAARARSGVVGCCRHPQRAAR